MINFREFKGTLLAFTGKVGKIFLGRIQNLGRMIIFIIKFFTSLMGRPYYGKEFIHQIRLIGYDSLPIVALTTFFTGMVLALQSYSGFSRFSAQGAIATVVVLSITRELAPVLTGLMVAGRMASSMAAELGTMVVTEQMDALWTLSTSPFKYLIAPRVLASLMILPFLVFVGDIIGVMGGYLVCIYKLGFQSSSYIHGTFQYLEPMDVILGLVKGCVFGFSIGIMGCYHGYYARGGAQGVGRATTGAVVGSSMMILILNYLLTNLFVKTHLS
jgi:phospholipid/cholesterol/gamma-HCH transport system permease protein